MEQQDTPILYRRLETSHGRPAFILDNFVTPEARQKVYRIYKDLPYEFSDSDRSDTQYIKHLKHEFELDNPLAVFLARTASSFLTDRGLAHRDVYRMYANFNLHGDFQFAHEDGEGWTALFFVNDKWEEDWGGEFTLYIDDELDFGYSISPKPGRMVIFDGMITHRGGVPSKLCYEPRISLAIKFLA